jgi:hypothetical protein
MATPRNETVRRGSKSPPGERGQSAARSAAIVIAVVGYLLLFFLAPIPEFKSAERPAGISRGELLANEILLVDEVVLGRRQADGSRAPDGWFGYPPAFALGDRLRVLVPAVIMFSLCGLAGWLLLGVLRVDCGFCALEVIFFSCTGGCSAVSLYTFAVGIAGGLHNRWLFLAPAGAVVLAGAYRLSRQAVAVRDRRPQELPSRADDDKARQQFPQNPAGAALQDETRNMRRWLWWGVPFTLAIVLGGTLTPFEFDVLEYHLQVPKEFYRQGHIGFLPHNVYGNMPLGAEMLSLAAMATLGNWWFGALVGKAMIALAAPLAAVGLLAAGRRFVDTTTGVVAALVYISIPWVARVSSLGLIEGVSALYLWGTVYAVLLWWRGERQDRLPRLLLAGLLAGSAAACKYPNVLFVLVPATVVVAIRSWRTAGDQNSDDAGPIASSRPRLFERLIPTACFLFAASVACGPWYAKNWILTGNPVYPLAYSIFDGRTRTENLDAQWSRAHRPPGYRPGQLLDSVANIAWRSSWLSPLVLPLAILGAMGTYYRRIAVGLAAYALIFLSMWWLFTHRIDRFWVPLDPVLAFLAGMSISRGAAVRWQWPAKALVGGGLSVNLLLILAGGGGDTSYFVSLQRLLNDPARIHYWHRYLNQHVAEDEVVLTIGDATVFDLKMPVLYSTVFDGVLFEELMKGRTAAERRQELAEHNVAYVAVDWTEIARYRSPGNYGFTDYIQPELFEELVREHVLDPPLRCQDPSVKSVGYEVFPVHDASTSGKQ